MINKMLYLISALLICSALMVIISSHTVFSLIFLVSSFILSSFILFLLECEFLGLIFIIVYVGAIAVLFLFSVMMLESKQRNLSKNSIKYMPLSVLFAICFLLPLFYEISLAFSLFIELNLFDTNSSYINWYDLIDSISDVEVYGRVLYTYFVLQFLFAGLILLLVLIGVVHLTKNSKNKKIEQSIFKQLSRSQSTFLKN